MDNYILFGSGGHASVVMDCLSKENKNIRGLFDDAPASDLFKGFPVLGEYDSKIFPEDLLIITIGNNTIRKKITERITHRYGTAVFPGNIISDSAVISEGTMVLQGAILNAGSFTGRHVILNTRSVVEHDCRIEDFVHLAPGSVVCGNCTISEGTLIGANAVVAPNIRIGKWCQISAGSSILENIPDYSLVMGVPGKVVKSFI